ncbi:MAG: hypothetical protein R3E31_04665 [Chloroflexota bacterium]
MEKALGPDHPDTAFASTTSAASCKPWATWPLYPFYERALAIKKRSGPVPRHTA